MPFGVLMVCTGNLCRSPAAELLLRAAVGPPRGSGIEVASAGTGAVSGRPAHPLTVQALSQRGIDAAAHVSQPLEAAMVRAADLVLTAAREHRTEVVRLDPDAVPRTFTLLEFARLIAGGAGGADRPELVVAAAARSRSGADASDDVRDPVLGGAPEHEAMVRTLTRAVAELGPALFGGTRA